MATKKPVEEVVYIQKSHLLRWIGQAQGFAASFAYILAHRDTGTKTRLIHLAEEVEYLAKNIRERSKDLP